MWKTIAAVMAIISSIIAITIYTTRLPEISDNVDANAKAIAENSTYIETVDNALENLQDAFDVLDAKKIYLHSIIIQGEKSGDSININLLLFADTNEELNTIDKLTTYIKSKYPTVSTINERYATTGSYGEYLILNSGVGNAGYPNAPTNFFIYYISNNSLTGVQIVSADVTQMIDYRTRIY